MARSRQIAGAREPMPRHVQPMLAKLVSEPFAGKDWIFEPKLDGIRAIAYLRNGELTLLTRRGLDLGGRYPKVEAALLCQKGDLIIDGEIAAIDELGRPSFQLLQQRSGLTAAHDTGKADVAVPVIYYAFDVLYAGGRNLLKVPLEERLAILRSSIKESAVVKVVRDLGDDGIKAFEACAKHGLEGIVAKRRDSAYQPGQRTNSWLKIKTNLTSEFLICGYTEGTGARNHTFGSLILGYHDAEGNLVYAGRVGTGFNEKKLKELLRAMKPLERNNSPFSRKIPGQSQANWVTPNLVAEVKFAEWTRDGILRAPVYMHLREDIAPAEVGTVKEVKVENVRGAKMTAQEKSKSKKSLGKSATKSEKSETSRSTAKSPVKVKKPEAKKAERSNKEETKSNDKKVKPPAEPKLHKPLTDKNTLDYAELDSILAQLDNDKNELILEVEDTEIKYSNLNKVLWPSFGKYPEVTKRDYLIYLAKMAAPILRYIHDRPITLIRYPNGIHGQKFFQKHWEKNLPAYMDTTTYFSEHSDKDGQFLVCNRLPALLWLAQIADLELHVLHTRTTPAGEENPDLSDDPTGSVKQVTNSVMNYPDFVVIDLDPYLYSGKEAKGEEPALHLKGFKKTCEVALHVKRILDHLDLDAFVKTSGRTGLHIYIPIQRTINYETVRDLAKTIGLHVMKDMPDDVTMTWAVKKRAGKVFFDHNMNGRGKTLPCPYSARNAAEASVSTPVHWDELTSIYPTDFTIFTAPERVAKIGDLWHDILAKKSDIRRVLKSS